MKFDFMPKSLLGKWAVGLGAALVVSAALSLIFAAAIGGNPDLVASNLPLKILSVAISIVFSLTAPLSLIVGIVAVVRNKEWPVFVTVVVLNALTFLMFLLGEFLFPH